MNLKNRLDLLRRQAGADDTATTADAKALRTGVDLVADAAELAGSLWDSGARTAAEVAQSRQADEVPTHGEGVESPPIVPRESRPGAAEPATRAEALRSRLQRVGGSGAPRDRVIRGRRESTVALAERLGGVVAGEHLILIETNLPLDTRHGHCRLADALEPLWPLAQPSAGPAMPSPQTGQRRQSFFPAAAEGREVRTDAAGNSIIGIDTETTGLAGGTGTAAFMVGIAEAGPTRIRIRQWLLTAFAGEAAMLAEVAASLAGADLMVSYNGKTFDLPLLRDRQRLQRGSALPEPPHLDLLYATRRLFRGAWPDCRLVTAEQRLLGLFRQDDLPGAQAPAAWRNFLAGSTVDTLPGVVRHNALDVLSLLVLGPELARALRDPPAYGADARAAARVWYDHGEPDRALQTLERARHQLDTGGTLDLARALRRAGRSPEAAAVWRRLAEQGVAEAVEHLAKYHEHVRRDWLSAMSYANRLAPDPGSERRRERLARRLHDRQGHLDF